MIFLIGTNHKIQTECESPSPCLQDKFNRFKHYVNATACLNKVAAIAEETSLELERKEGKSIARCIAESMQPPLGYVPCDPDSTERKRLGIPTGIEIYNNRPPELPIMEEWVTYRDAEVLKYFPAREEFWIERIRPLLPGPVLLICGANHVRTFPSRLGDIQYEILIPDWWEADDEIYGELPMDERLCE